MWHRHDSIIQRFKSYYSNNVRRIIRRLSSGFPMHWPHDIQNIHWNIQSIFCDTPNEIQTSANWFALALNQEHRFILNRLLLLHRLFCSNVRVSFFYVFRVLCDYWTDHLLHIFILRFFVFLFVSWFLGDFCFVAISIVSECVSLSLHLSFPLSLCIRAISLVPIMIGWKTKRTKQNQACMR